MVLSLNPCFTDQNHLMFKLDNKSFISFIKCRLIRDLNDQSFEIIILEAQKIPGFKKLGLDIPLSISCSSKHCQQTRSFLFAVIAHCYWQPGSHGSSNQANSHNYDIRRNVFFNNNPELAPHNYHYQQLNGNQIVSRQAPCNCIKLKFCSPVMDMARKMYTGFIADYINSQLQVIACNYIDGEMAVCCPKNHNEPDSREKRGGHGKHGHGHGHDHDHGYGHNKKWVWDTEEVTDSEEVEGPGTPAPTQYPASQYTSYPITGFLPFSKDHLKNSKFVAEHEDPNSLKSCPPQFAEEFDLPKNHSFFKEPPEAVTPSVRIQTITTPSPTVPAPLMLPEMQAKMSMINDESCGRSIGSRIIGGEDAGVGRFAWIGRLAYRNKSEFAKKLNPNCIN